MDQDPPVEPAETQTDAEPGGAETRQSRRPRRRSIVSAVGVLVAAGAATGLLLSMDDAETPKPASTSPATTKAEYGDAPAQIAPATTAAKPETLPVKVGADVTYGGLRFTNNATAKIKIVTVKPVIVGGDDKRINVADVVVVYPVPENAVELAKGWPPKEYGPNVFFAPGDLEIPSGDEVQILLRLARTDNKKLEIDGFEVTYSIGEESFTETIGKKLTLGE